MTDNNLAANERPDEPGWIEFTGGDCPVAPTTLVEVRFRYYGQMTDVAGEFDWFHIGGRHDITEYRIIESKNPGRSQG